MARTQARIFTRIWQDPDFRDLGSEAQRVYMLALSQPDMNFCGVVPYTPKRWSTFAKGSTPKAIRSAVAELVKARFVVVDEDTEELWVRSLSKNDGVLKSPNLIQPMWRDFFTICSIPIRDGFLEGLPEGVPPPDGQPPPEPSGGGSRVRSAQPLTSCRLPSSSSSAEAANPPAVESANGSSSVDAGARDDDDLQLEGLWRDWAQLDLEAREAETGKRVRDRESWLTTARKRRLAAHGAAARALWDAEPDLAVDDVIRRLEPPKLTVVPDGHQRHRDDWGSTGAEVWDEVYDEELGWTVVRRKGAS